MQFVVAFATSFILSLFATPLVIKLARRYSLVDSPLTRAHPAQVHKGTVPRAGGIALGGVFLISTLILLSPTQAILGILLASGAAVTVGIIDDLHDSSPYKRLLANFLTASIIVAVGIGIPFVTNPFNGIIRLDNYSFEFFIFNQHFSILWLADLAAIIWIVWTMNIVGWSGGVDGQLPGFVSIAAVVIGLLSFSFSAHDISQTEVAILSFICAGTYAGFIPWNFFPQKIMPGYSGKSLAGLLLATLSILSGAKLGTALLVLSIPTTDALFTIGRRIFQGKSPFLADWGHLHHKLLERGWGKRRIALFYWGSTALFGFLALNLTSTQGKFFSAVLIVTVILMGLIWLHLVSHPQKS